MTRNLEPDQWRNRQEWRLVSVPLVHIVNMKESYENIKLLLEKIQHEKHDWNVCGFIAVLPGLQLGNAKFCRFLCEWDSKGRIHHHIPQQWPK